MAVFCHELPHELGTCTKTLWRGDKINKTVKSNSFTHYTQDTARFIYSTSGTKLFCGGFGSRNDNQRLNHRLVLKSSRLTWTETWIRASLATLRPLKLVKKPVASIISAVLFTPEKCWVFCKLMAFTRRHWDDSPISVRADDILSLAHAVQYSCRCSRLHSAILLWGAVWFSSSEQLCSGMLVFFVNNAAVLSSAGLFIERGRGWGKEDRQWARPQQISTDDVSHCAAASLPRLCSWWID